MERLQLIWSKGTYSQNFNPRSDERSDSNFAQKNFKKYTKPLNILLFFTIKSVSYAYIDR